jgi:hypothetical protein
MGWQTVRLQRVKPGLRMTDLINRQPTKNNELSVDEIQGQLQRVLHSDTLRNSYTLQQLLQFLGVRAIEGNAEGLKEYTIGVEAFGRKPEFDPKTDTIVRVQTHRLRQKLKEYYEQEGLHDSVLIKIPRGHYFPSFELRVDSLEYPELDSEETTGIADSETGVTSASDPDAVVVDPGSTKIPPRSRVSRYFNPRLILAAVACLVALFAGYMVGSRGVDTLPEGATSNSGAVSFLRRSADPVKNFWAAIVGNDPSPIIAYPNAVFLLDDSNDLLRFRQGASDNRGARVDPDLARRFASNPGLVANAGQLYYEDGYTGTGELEGVSMLTALFAQMGMRPIIKTSRNITPDDLEQHTVILLGSPFQNIAVGQLLAVGDFRFENPDSRREEWRAQIVNDHPAPNESSTYHTERDPETQVLKADYSVISIQPGVAAGHNIAVLGGLDTKGTQGATRFATSRSGVEALSAALAAKGLGAIGAKSNGGSRGPWFQALVLVHLEKGDQVLSTELMAVHPLPGKKSTGTSGGGDSSPSIHK